MTCISARGYGHSKKASRRETDKRKCCSESHSEIWGFESTAPIILGVKRCQLQAPALSRAGKK